MTGRLFFGLVVLLNLVGLSSADNWPHWRGPTGNSVAKDAAPPTEWSATENVKWKVPIPGRGSGSPVIWEDQVFVVTAVTSGEGDASAESSAGADEADSAGPAEAQRRPRGEPGGDFGRGRGRDRGGDRGFGRRFGRRGGGRGTPSGPLSFELHCYDRTTGDLRWKRVATEGTPHEGTHSTNGYASASPCTDGEHVYAYFGSMGLYCFTMAGEPVWQRDLGDLNMRHSFGEGSSPTLAGDKLLLTWDHEGPSYLYALDKRTGDEVWKTPRDEPSCWATPLVVDYNGKQQVITNGQSYARAYDLQTGEELWRCGGQTERPVASPVAADGLVFIGSGHRGSFLAAFKPDGEGDIGGSEHIAWSISRNTPDIASPLLSEDRLYFFKGKSGLISCYDAKSGEPHYISKRVGLDTIYASPVAAGGNVYLTDRSGTTVVLEDSADFKEISTNSVGETVDATPAPVGDELFIRGENHLFCIANGKG